MNSACCDLSADMSAAEIFFTNEKNGLTEEQAKLDHLKSSSKRRKMKNKRRRRRRTRSSPARRPTYV